MNQAIGSNAEELKRTLAFLQARDLRSMGFEAKIAHNRRLESLKKAYAAATKPALHADRTEQAKPNISQQ